MIWFDLATPKSVLFFYPLMKALKKDIFITTRASESYTETKELLDMLGFDYLITGSFGGADIREKLIASMERMINLAKVLEEKEVDVLVNLCSVDANRLAFGLKIPIINFYDIPLSDHRSNFSKALPQARLTLPLSKVVFKPFVVPDEIFLRFALEQDQIITYDFIDPLIWLKDFKPDINYVKDVMKIPVGEKPIIVVREEEFKASYVEKKFPILYEGLLKLKDEIDANFVIIPRYEANHLKELFPFAIILEKKYIIQHLLAFADLFIGGGGTINLEATYFGTPVISTRSFVSHYDKYMITVGLMRWVQSSDELVEKAKRLIGKRFNELAENVWGSMNVDMDLFIETIEKVRRGL